MELVEWAQVLKIDPPSFLPRVPDPKEALRLMDFTSYLGGPKIEGVVLKNYSRAVDIGGHIYPIMCAKFVSEKFKEVHGKTWKKNHTPQGGLESLKESYRTEARWRKAVERLRDKDALLGDPKDIGPLVKSIREDITEEEKEEIKEDLWKIYKDEILRNSVRGFPEWYKETLARGEI